MTIFAEFYIFTVMKIIKDFPNAQKFFPGVVFFNLEKSP